MGRDRVHDTDDDITSRTLDYPRPPIDWPRLIAILIPVLLIVAVIFRALFALSSAFAGACRRWGPRWPRDAGTRKEQ